MHSTCIKCLNITYMYTWYIFLLYQTIFVLIDCDEFDPLAL